MGKNVPFLANVVAGSNLVYLLTNAQLFHNIEDIFGKKWRHKQNDTTQMLKLRRNLLALDRKWDRGAPVGCLKMCTSIRRNCKKHEILRMFVKQVLGGYFHNFLKKFNVTLPPPREASQGFFCMFSSSRLFWKLFLWAKILFCLFKIFFNATLTTAR